MGKHDKKDQQKVLLAQTQNRPLSYKYQTSEFLEERFNFFGNTQAAIISGGTFSNQQSDDTHGVLDASVTDYIYDEHGVRIGLTMATADGLGHSDREEENRSTALVSSSACETFVNNSKNRSYHNIDTMSELMLEAAEESKRSRLKRGKRSYDSKSSLAATVIYRQPDGSLKAIMANVGDGMIVVINGKTGEIKHCVAARDYGHYQIGSTENFSPNSVQDLNVENLAINSEVIELNGIKEDDLVIQLTDGIWGEFECSKELKQIDGKNYREQRIVSKEFESVIKQAVLVNPMTHAVDIGQAIVRSLAESTLQKRQKFQELMAVLEPFIADLSNKQYINKEEYNAHTIAVWLNELNEKGNDGAQASASLRNYLAEAEHDGIHYHIETCPVGMLVNDLPKKPFGDCATLAIMRVPNHKKELVRALTTHPENEAILLKRINQEMSQEERSDIEKSLSLESSLPDMITDDDLTCIGSRYLTVYANSYVSQLVANSPNTEKPVLLRELQRKLTSMSQPIPDLAQMNAIFDVCNSSDLFNRHRNPSWDSFFGLKTTQTWGATIKEIRDFAVTKLFNEVDGLQDPDEKVKLLHWAKKQPLFNQHRNNFIITGAWGNTAAVNKINDKLDEACLEAGVITFQ